MNRKKKPITHDPFLEREQAKYGKPIPSREFILDRLEAEGRPLSYKQLVRLLKLKEKDALSALQRRLGAMVREGQLMQNRGGHYCLINKIDLIAGHIEAHPDGYGFLIPKQGGEDYYLNPRQMRGVLHGDQVLVREAEGSRPGRREAIIVRIAERSLKQVVGRLIREQGLYLVAPDDKLIVQDIVIPPEHLNKARENQIVVVELIPQTNLRARLFGRIIEVLGDAMAPGMEIDIAIRAHALPHRWPEALLDEIAGLKEKVSESAVEGRTDLRHLPFVTIDGEDAQDFDDAVFCQKKANQNWVLYVAIADVSHYVLPNTALDKEAALRGNSVYFPGRVIPMLPEVLSNGLCSLKPQVDRLCMVCEMEVDSAGELQNYRFYESVIHSRARLTYTQVAALLERDKLAQRDLAPVADGLWELYALYQILRHEREVRGAIDFELPESKIIFNEQQKIERIARSERNEAHKLIEECMLLANVSAARFLEKNKIPALYRIHPSPPSSKVEDVREFLQEFDLKLEGGETPAAKDYANLLKLAKKKVEFPLIQTVLLRSLTQATYSPANEGHFGLAYPAYAHFTSPIRRYPDLLVHRAIRYRLHRKKISTFLYDQAAMQQLGEYCSMTERRADEATREAVEWLKCEFMYDRVGEIFDGIISGVTAFGVFVELKDIYVEGLVHVASLRNDYYHYEQKRHCLRGERTGVFYRLGDPIKVKVMRVSLEDKKIDFELADPTMTPT